MNVAAHIFRGRREKLTFVNTSVNAASTSACATRRWICGARFSVPRRYSCRRPVLSK